MPRKSKVNDHASQTESSEGKVRAEVVNPIQPATVNDCYIISRDEQSRATAMKSLSDGLAEVGFIQDRGSRATASRTQFRNVEPNISVRSEFTREDYEFFRPLESIPSKMKDVIRACDAAYKRVGIVRNTFDLMADFASKGVGPTHPNPKVQAFYRAWFESVNGPERSERFLSLLFRQAITVVRRLTKKVNVKLANEWKKSVGVDLPPTPNLSVPTREIPGKYAFLNPLALEVVDNSLANFVGKPKYGIKIAPDLKKSIINPGDNSELIDYLPKEILDGVRNSSGLVILDPDKTIVSYFKKDDWEVWPVPILYSILKDLIQLEKTKLADLAALDGAISHIRIWTLGDHTLPQPLIPTKEGLARLANQLMSNTGGGSMDLIWTSDLKLEETSTDVYKFLGKEKYEPILSQIYDGLGIPSTLTSGSQTGGVTNNYVSLKTLIERLNYGRSVLNTFWANEFKIVQKAMEFDMPAVLTYDRMILTDESAEKALLIQLADRNLISVQTLQEHFGEFPEVEKWRQLNEDRLRQKEKFPAKAGSWYNPQTKEELTKIALQAGYITPTQAGLEVPDKAPDEIHPLEIAKKAAEQKKNPGQPQQGRPTNSKDSKKRKTKTVKPRAKGSVALWASNAQRQIAELVNPLLLEHFGRKNMRSLTDTEAAYAESYRTNLLFNFTPFSEITLDAILAKTEAGLSLPTDYSRAYSEILTNFKSEHKKSPTLEDLRQLNVIVYSILEEENG